MYKIVVQIPEGWGDYFSGQKLGNSGEEEGLREIPSVEGYGYFLELHNIHFAFGE